MQLERLRDDRAAALAILRRAVELGVDHVDTAQFYGDGLVNGLLREALHPYDEVLVVSKVGADPDPDGPIPLRPAQRPEQLRASVEDNLRSLGVDRIPVVNLRRLDTGPGLRAEGDQVVDLDDQLAVMVALRDEGKIGAFGLSSVTLDGLRRALPAGVACVQNAYSLVTRSDEDMLALCTAQGIAWVRSSRSAAPSPASRRSPRSLRCRLWRGRSGSRRRRSGWPDCSTTPERAAHPRHRGRHPSGGEPRRRRHHVRRGAACEPRRRRVAVGRGPAGLIRRRALRRGGRRPGEPRRPLSGRTTDAHEAGLRAHTDDQPLQGSPGTSARSRGRG